MSAFARASFSLAVLFILATAVFLFLNQRDGNIPNFILPNRSLGYKLTFYIIMGVLLTGLFICALFVLLWREPGRVVRWSAMSAVFIVPVLYWMITTYFRDQRYVAPRNRNLVQIMLYAAFLLGFTDGILFLSLFWIS